MPDLDRTAAATARAEVIKRNLEQLPPDEKALIGRAAQKFFTHVSFGVAFGAVVGAGIPYRAAILRVMRASNALKAEGAAPSSFYPTLAKAAEGAAKGGTETGPQGRFRIPLIAQGVLGTMGGAYLGGWLGGASGTLASARLIEREMPGGTERIKVTGLSIQRQLEELAKTGKVPIPPAPQADAEQRFSRVEDDSAVDSRRFEWTESGDEQQRAAAPRPTVEGAATSSRWEELRKARAAPPSAWDTIRDSSARSSLPNGAADSSSPRDDQELRSTSAPTDDGAALSEKEARRREFEALVERERMGGNDDADAKRWR